MRRISQLVGLDFSTGRAISPLPVNRECVKGLIDFHDVSRASTDAQDEPLHASSPLRVREAPLARVENHAQSYRSSRLARFNAVAETTQLSDHFSGAAFCR